MYHAKSRPELPLFYAEMNAAAVERLLLKSKLRRALERDEFVLRYTKWTRDREVVGSEPCCAGAAGHGEIALRSSFRWRGIQTDPRHRRVGAEPGVHRLFGLAAAVRDPVASRSTCR